MVTRIRCPRCRRINDEHVATSGKNSPDRGDIAVCWNCQAISVFDANLHGDLTVRDPTASELAEIKDLPEVHRAIVARWESTSILEAVALYTHMSYMDADEDNLVEPWPT
jgi:hypothetical protein